MCVRPSLLTALISWASLLVAIIVAGQQGNTPTVAVIASRARLSPSLSPTDCSPGSFTLSALQLMTLSNIPQISAVQHIEYLILTLLKLILIIYRARLSPSLSPTDCGPGSFTLSALQLMTLSNIPQISAVQHMEYLILTLLKLILTIYTRIFKRAY